MAGRMNALKGKVSRLKGKIPSIQPDTMKNIKYSLVVAGIFGGGLISFLGGAHYIKNNVGLKQGTTMPSETPVVMESPATYNYDVDFNITGPTTNSLEFNLQTQESASPTAQIESPTEVLPANTPVPPVPAYTPVPPVSIKEPEPEVVQNVDLADLLGTTNPYGLFSVMLHGNEYCPINMFPQGGHQHLRDIYSLFGQGNELDIKLYDEQGMQIHDGGFSSSDPIFDLYDYHGQNVGIELQLLDPEENEISGLLRLPPYHVDCAGEREPREKECQRDCEDIVRY